MPERDRAERRAEPTGSRPGVQTYDRLAARYDRAISPLERLLLARLRARSLAALPEEGGGRTRLLEIGAGTGANFPFYPPEAEGVASEPSAEMIRVAASKPRPARIALVRSDAQRLPFPDASFDAALATLVFCSVSTPAACFSELRRVVRPGGTVVLLEHVRPKGVLGYLFDALSLLTVALFEDHFNRRTARAARDAGLEVLRRERHAFGIIEVIVCRV